MQIKKRAMDELLKNKIDTLPESPGVYQYFNSKGVIIYVGKAKNLKRRVSSYFNKTHESLKTKKLVQQIAEIEYIVVNSENEALLLENNLIKRYQPHYNILLKDGKSYPWLCITHEKFPRVFKTRTLTKNADFFGPYSSVRTLDLLLDLIHELYPIRTCNLQLNNENISSNKFKVCLEYHIKNCLGVCVGLHTESDYQKNIDEIKQIVQGNSHLIINYLLEQIQHLANEEKFEEAQKLKLKYEVLLKYQAKTIITTPSDDNLDVFAYDEDENYAYINILRIAKGSIIQGLTIEYQKRIDEEKTEIFALAILELRERLKSTNKTLIVPFIPDEIDENLEFIIPQRGNKKKLLDLAYKNVAQYKIDKYKQSEKLNPDQRAMRLMKEIQSTLHLPKIPETIECFDNSNISGTNAVAACVVFKKCKPSKKDYRTYNIKTVVGADDYASMKEVVHRRYTRLQDEQQALPDLIITDGGKGQMEVVRQVIEDELQLQIPIIGLAKNNQHKTNEILFGNPPQTIGLKPTDFTFKFLASVQDEVHRFAISFHRKKRSKSQTSSELDLIKGIGEKTKFELLKHFKSLKQIKNASKNDLEKIVGTSRASIIYDYFNQNLTP
jgi:excinuclease ABC subunit C